MIRVTRLVCMGSGSGLPTTVQVFLSFDCQWITISPTGIRNRRYHKPRQQGSRESERIMDAGGALST